MALETLKNVNEIGGFEVVVLDDLRETNPELFPKENLGQMDHIAFERDIRPHKFIYIRNDKNSITFNLQNGPIDEVGVNGCQVDTMIEAAKMIIEKLNEKFPCIENQHALCRIDEVLFWLCKRKSDRLKRGVEGKSLT